MPFPRITRCPARNRWLVLLLATLASIPLPGQRVLVRAVDQLSGTGIANAELVFPGVGVRGRSDASGWIQLDLQMEGVFETILIADGYGSRRFQLEVAANKPNIRQELFLNPLIVNLEAFEVEGSLTDADRDALAKREAVAPVEQLSGEALQDVTDDGIADTLEKISGVTVETDGETVSGVNIRGAGPRQTRITLDGQSVAGGGGRGTTRGMRAMSQIPNEFLDNIQVMKAPTPDMDADAIGGSVDLQTSRVSASRKARTTASLRSSWQEEPGTFGHRVSVAHAEPLTLAKSDSRFGILLAVNAQKNENAPEILRVQNQWPELTSPQTGEPVQTLARLRMGSREVSNEGWGIVLNIDLQLNKQNHFYLKSMWNQRQTRLSIGFLTVPFIQGATTTLLSDFGEFEGFPLEKQLLEKAPEDSSGSIVFGGEHKLGDWTIDESIGYSFARSDANGSFNGVFITSRNFGGSYDLSGSSYRPVLKLTENGVQTGIGDLREPAPFDFRRYDLLDNEANDSELALRLNLTREVQKEAANWVWKAGVKARIRDAENNQDTMKYFSANGSFSLEEVAGQGPAGIFRNRYPLGPSWSPVRMQERFREYPEDFRLDPMQSLFDSAAGDFTVSESIYAVYAMVQRETDRWTLITGLRLERTDSETQGFETISELDENNERVVQINPVSISDTYDMLLPGFHVLYKVTPNWVIRCSLTRTLQRPDFREQSPSARVDLDRKRIRAGNPELDPFDAKAVDLGTDLFSEKWGSFSFALFYKRIDDFIVDTERETEYLGEPGFILSQSVNGSPADLYGVEASYATLLTFLPDPFPETELTASYVLTDSTAAYPNYPGENTTLPKQVEQTLNLALRWKLADWTLAYRIRYRGEQLNNLIRPGQDQFNDGFWSHVINLNYRVNDTVNLSIGLANLNKPDRSSYQGSTTRLVGNVAGTRSFNIGMSVKL